MPTLVGSLGPYSVPPAPAAPSGNQARIESFEEAEPFDPDAEEPVPPTPLTSDTPRGSFGTFLPANEEVPAAPVINQAQV